MFQSRLRCHEYQKFKDLCETDVNAALNYKITFDSCDQYMLDDLYHHIVDGTPLNYEMTSASCETEDSIFE